MCQRVSLMFLAGVSAMLAQPPTGPVINPRGVTNYFTQQPAPARVAPGGLIQINGLNLGPADGLKADGVPWPTRLGDIQVTVNGRPAPIFSASPGSIVAQVPYEVQPSPDPAEVVVRRGMAASRPARILVNAPVVPSIRTADDSGYGAPWGTAASNPVKLTASGIGQAEPRMASGAAGPAEPPAVPVNRITAFIGGLRANAAAAASSQRPGEFEIAITPPEGARPGDPITVLAGAAAANRTIYQPAQSVEVDYLPLPEGTPELRFLSDAGVNGRFLMAAGARAEDGCMPAIAIDVLKKSVSPASDCLTSANSGLSPLVSPVESDSIAALVGPPAGDGQTGISSSVKIFSAASEPITVDLPSAASLLNATQTDYRATMPGTPPRQVAIDDRTGEVRTVQAGAAGAGAAQPINFATLEIDGLKNVYANAGVGQNRIAVTIGDDPLKPTRAKFAIINPAGEVLLSKDFPDGLLPLLPPQAPRPNQNLQQPRPRESFTVDLQGRALYALARSADQSRHALIAFAFDDSDPRVVSFPDGWFVTACTPNIPMFVLDLSRRVAMMASKVAETEFKQTCTSSGWLLLDFASRELSAVALPVQAQVLANGASEMNDYVYASSYDNTRTNTSDTLFVLDGVNASAFSLGVPTTVNGFAVNGITRIPDVNALLAPATRTVAGDQGLVFFNLEAQAASVLPVPDGFARVAEINDGGIPCCLATRKLVARALRPGSAGLVIYNLLNNDVAVVPNPPGVTSIGLPPAAAAPGGGQTPPGGGQAPPGGQLPPGGQVPPGGGGQVPGGGVNVVVAGQGGLVTPNPRANTVAAVALDGGRQVGVLVVRIP